jgi:hypothetical protein
MAASARERKNHLATNNNRAGKSTRDMAKRRRKTYFLIGIIAIVVLGIFTLISGNAKVLNIGGGAILVLLVAVIVIRTVAENLVDRGIKSERRAIRGAKAEEKVGDILMQLSPDYLVLHDVRSPSGNIDHIVIGRNNGLFLIETKAHGGTVTTTGDTLLVNNKLPEKNFISQALQNTYWLRDEVAKIIGEQPWITPVIVFTNAFVTASRPVKGVTIVNRKFLLSLLQRVGKPNPVNARIWEMRARIQQKLL